MSTTSRNIAYDVSAKVRLAAWAEAATPGGRVIGNIARANVLLLVQYGLTAVVPLLLVPHIVRVIGLAEYGAISIVLAWASYGSAIVGYAFHLTGPSRVATARDDKSLAAIFAEVTLAKGVLLVVAAAIMAAILLFAHPSQSSSEFAPLLLWIMPLAAAMNSAWFLQGRGRFFPVCVVSILGALLTLLIGFAFIAPASPHAVDVTVAVVCTGAVVAGAATLVIAARSVDVARTDWQLSGALAEVKVGWHLFISQFIAMLYSASGPIVIGALVDAHAAGAYSVVERVVTAVAGAAMLTHTAAYPRLAGSYGRDKAAYMGIMKLVLVTYFAVCAVVAIGVLALRHEVVQFLFHEQRDAYYTLLYLGLAWLFLGVFGTALTGYLTVSGRAREVWPLTVSILLAAVAIGVPAVLAWGGAGWLLALVLSQTIVLYSGYKYWRREHGR